MNKDLYEELALDLVKNAGLSMFSARKVVDFLKKEGHIDYDALKEHYLEFYLGEEENEV